MWILGSDSVRGAVVDDEDLDLLGHDLEDRPDQRLDVLDFIVRRDADQCAHEG